MKINKKFLIILILILTIIVFILFKNIENKQDEETKNKDNTPIENIQNNEVNTLNSNNNNNENIMKTGENKMEIEIAGKICTASLEDNETTRAFKNLLPLSIKMSELNENEKYYFLPESIKKDASKNLGTINAGDIMLYSDNCIVIFYKTFKSLYNYIKIGHIEDLSSLEEVLESNDTNIKFNLSK